MHLCTRFCLERLSNCVAARSLSYAGDVCPFGTLPNVAALLEVSNLGTEFAGNNGVVRAVDGVSFEIDAGETVGIVGESGSGKSVTGLSLLRLVPPPGRIRSGSIRFEGIEISTARESVMRRLRGGDIAMIFQDPYAALNPVMMVGAQVAEAIALHQELRKSPAFSAAVSALREVHLPSADRLARRYPHQLSGGQRQRVMLAMAFACRPKLLIADEPTTALDVTLQAQILGLVKELQRRHNTAVLLISHDIGLIGAMCDRVLVMYAGHIVEDGSAQQILHAPAHPYTQGLLASLPRQDERLTPIAGQPPNLAAKPPGCPFEPRCPYVHPRCREAMPPLFSAGDGHRAACVLLDE